MKIRDFEVTRLQSLAKKRRPTYLEELKACGKLSDDGKVLKIDTDSECYQRVFARRDEQLTTRPARPAQHLPIRRPTTQVVPAETPEQLIAFNQVVCANCPGQYFVEQVVVTDDQVYTRCSGRTCCGGKPAVIPLGIPFDACPKQYWTKARQQARVTNFFDRVVILNLRRRPERLDRVQREIEAVKWPFVKPIIFDAVDGVQLPKPRTWQAGDGAWGCMQSHRRILEQAIMDNVSSLLILEDDVTFVPGFRDRVADFLLHVPDDWDGLMIGGQHMQSPVTTDDQKVVKCLNTQRTHCYAVRGRYMRDLYQHFVSSAGHCDHRMGEIQSRYNIYAPATFFAGQTEGPSDIDGQSNHPTRFWAPQNVPYYIALCKCPREAMRGLIQRGFHFGYSRDQDDLDLGLKDIFQGNQVETVKHQQLRDWVAMIQREAGAVQSAIPAIWYPDAPEDFIVAALKPSLIILEGQTTEQLIIQWQEKSDAKDVQPFG